MTADRQLSATRPRLARMLCAIGVVVCSAGATALGQTCPTSGNDCCQASPTGTPGCNDTTCCETVCGMDTFCCTVSWDSICADEADSLCAICSGLCPASANDCCLAASTPGCSDVACCEAVCAVDAFCCTVAWDGVCAGEAASLCVACQSGVCGGSENDCCAASPVGTPACGDADCCNAVCEVDPLCCDVAWDIDCATQAASICGICGIGCGGSSHSCWESGGPGCGDEACCLATCAFDPSCCETNWDSYCVWAAMALCGPPPGVCGAAGHAAYTEGGPGCDDVACCESVCGGDPSCCTTAWDAGCVGLAGLFCGPNSDACGNAGHDCVTQGPSGCDDVACCELVCVVDASCCSSGWDSNCVQQANLLCGPPACEIVMPPGARLEIEPCGEDWNGGCTQAPSGESSCCQPLCGLWYCDNYVCTNAVWAVDPFCYCVCWDYICAQEAAILCPDLCTLAAIAFEPITCGETVYGTLWANEQFGDADTDWYELILDEPARIEVTVTSGLKVTFGIAETDGVPDCALASEIDPVATVPSCGTVTVSRCLEPGVHWVKLAPAYAAVATCGWWTSPYLLSVRCTPDCDPTDPPNDVCEAALPLVEGLTEFDTTDAATEGSAVPGCSGTVLAKDLWYTFDAPRSGAVRFSTCNQTSFATALVLASGDCGDQTTIACNDVDFDCPAGGSSLEAEVLAGQRYYLRLGGYGSGQGSGTLSVAYLPCEPAYAIDLALESLPPPWGVDCGGINAGGTICGRNQAWAITWSPDTGLVYVAGTLPISYATDVNDAGVVVGSMAMTTSSPLIPFIATNNQATPLPFPPLASHAFPLAINNAGTIAGDTNGDAVRWVAGVPEYLDLPMGPCSTARDINELGEICGTMGGCSSALGSEHGFVWSPEGVVDIVPPEGASSEATAINDLGQVAGYLRIPNPGGTGTVVRAFVWENGAYTVIEPWAGFGSSIAVDLNNTGVLIGSMIDGNDSVPFVWFGGAAIPIYHLAVLDPYQSITELVAINDAGQMAGILTIDDPSALWPVASPTRLDPNPPVSDLDCDGAIDATDLSILLGAWGPCGALLPCVADLDHDGHVGALDLAILLGAWTG